MMDTDVQAEQLDVIVGNVNTGLSSVMHKHFTVERLAATDSKYHVSLLVYRKCAETFHIVIGAVCSEQFFSDYSKLRFGDSRSYLFVGGCKSFFTADDQHGAAVRFTYRSDLVVDCAAYRVARQMYFVIFKFHICNPFHLMHTHV